MTTYKFAHALNRAWKYESQKAKFSEVQQFRALMKSFDSLKYPFKLEEFHGMKHQVIFNGKGSWGRIPARCEISDLLIISYKKFPLFEARATLLQAKKSDAKHLSLCHSWSKSSPITSFKANLEQWDLLSRRPNILPFPPFNCPTDVLSGAILPSIGSIGVFHKLTGKDYNFFYMSADIAHPLGAPKKKYAKLQTTSTSLFRKINTYDECTFACCIFTFATSLFDLKIGTPIDSNNVIDTKDETYRNSVRGWLKNILRSHLSVVSSNAPIARELIGLLQSDYNSDEMIPNPPSIILINCDKIEEKMSNPLMD